MVWNICYNALGEIFFCYEAVILSSRSRFLTNVKFLFGK